MRPLTLSIEAGVENQDGVRNLDGPWTGYGPGLECWRVTGTVRLAASDEESDRVVLEEQATCDGWPADVLELPQRVRFALEDWILEEAEQARRAA